MRVAIAGAGAVGRSIARELIGNGHEVLLIDKDPGSIKPDRVPDAEWLLADSCELSSLEEARLQDCDVVIAATGDDKVNLVTSLLAKTEFGVPRTVGRVNHPNNEWLFTEAWGVDVNVSTPRIMSALVEEAVTVGDLVRLFTFRQGNANLVEMTLPAGLAVRRQAVGPDPVAGELRAGRRSCATARSTPPTRSSPSRPATSCCSSCPPRSRTSSSRCSRPRSTSSRTSPHPRPGRLGRSVRAMLTVEESIVIDRPRAEVFAFFADPDNVALYSSNLSDYKVVSGENHRDRAQGRVLGEGGRRAPRLHRRAGRVRRGRALQAGVAPAGGSPTRSPSTFERRGDSAPRSPGSRSRSRSAASSSSPTAWS